MLAVWAIGALVGLAIAVVASRRALDAARDLGHAVGLSPFTIGVTIVAVGTDLPEVANSLISSAAGHGDLNVGDSVGSVVTQSTIVMGLTCFAGTLKADRRSTITTGALTVLALVTAAILFADQHFGRSDAAILLAMWIAGTVIIQPPGQRRTPSTDHAPVGRSLLAVVGWLTAVGAGAALTVESFTRAAEILGAPQFLLSFFVLALGTSLPELVIAARAVRQNAPALALGDLIGSSFVDATLSPAVGPLIFPTALSAGLERSFLIVAITVAIGTIVLARNREHRWGTGLILILLYLGLYPALIG